MGLRAYSSKLALPDTPAVAVSFICGKISDEFTPADNSVWIEAGETVEIATDRDDYKGITAWNIYKYPPGAG